MGSDDDKSTPPTRKSLPTPYIDHDDAVVMIDPSTMTRIACIDAAIEVGMRPVMASRDTAARVVTTVRPLVIVVDNVGSSSSGAGSSSTQWTDLAVGVGAQLVLVGEKDVGPALSERIKLAGVASRALRTRSENKI